MVRLCSVEVFKDSELGGAHEGVFKDIELLDLVVKEYKEGGVVKQHDETWVGEDEGPRRHVGVSGSGVVTINFGNLKKID